MTDVRLILLPALAASVDLTKYYGRWYQMYDDAIVQDTFENRSLCDTADCEQLRMASQASAASLNLPNLCPPQTELTQTVPSQC